DYFDKVFDHEKLPDLKVFETIEISWKTKEILTKGQPREIKFTDQEDYSEHWSKVSSLNQMMTCPTFESGSIGSAILTDMRDQLHYWPHSDSIFKIFDGFVSGNFAKLCLPEGMRQALNDCYKDPRKVLGSDIPLKGKDKLRCWLVEYLIARIKATPKLARSPWYDLMEAFQDELRSVKFYLAAQGEKQLPPEYINQAAVYFSESLKVTGPKVKSDLTYHYLLEHIPNESPTIISRAIGKQIKKVIKANFSPQGRKGNYKLSDGRRFELRVRTLRELSSHATKRAFLVDAWKLRTNGMPPENLIVLLGGYEKAKGEKADSAPKLQAINEFEASGWKVFPWDFHKSEPLFLNYCKERFGE
ncbi:hypothetical protein N8667_06950, partial [Verrucomicrobia bacterium]|nr:hypothetical protein [Verrucomicrobiota bacterium]